MNESVELEPVEQKTVIFYGDELVAVRTNDNHVYVSVRHLCDALGLDRPSQVRRIKRNEVLADGYQGDVKIESPGGAQPAGVLRVDLVPLWLTGIRIKAVRPELQDRLGKYQREAAKVLWEAFQSGQLTGEPGFDELLKTDSEAVQAYQMLRAMVKLARHQILLEARVDENSRRLELIESTLGDPKRHITPEQASEISQAVKMVAMELSKRSGRNEYGGVYGEFYRKFGITSYKQLPVNRFEEAVSFLTEWHQSLVDTVAF
jgi:hypothetical protein